MSYGERHQDLRTAKEVSECVFALWTNFIMACFTTLSGVVKWGTIGERIEQMRLAIEQLGRMDAEYFSGLRAFEFQLECLWNDMRKHVVAEYAEKWRRASDKILNNETKRLVSRKFEELAFESLQEAIYFLRGAKGLLDRPDAKEVIARYVETGELPRLDRPSRFRGTNEPGRPKDLGTPYLNRPTPGLRLVPEPEPEVVVLRLEITGWDANRNRPELGAEIEGETFRLDRRSEYPPCGPSTARCEIRKRTEEITYVIYLGEATEEESATA